MSRILVRAGAEYLAFSPDEWTALTRSDRARYEVVIRGLTDVDAAALLAAELRKLCSEPPPGDPTAATVETSGDA
jgi:hypothetical protein